MRKRNGYGDYEFEELNITYGNGTYTVSGTANYEIEDHGIGRYEYWGETGHDHQYVACFISADIEDIVLQEAVEYGHQTITDEDRINIAELVVDALNDDDELCSELAEKHS
jgi:hypothetical protein